MWSFWLNLVLIAEIFFNKLIKNIYIRMHMIIRKLVAAVCYVLLLILESFCQVKKLKTIVPHHDMVEAPCQYASYCGGCKTQNLSYQAQIKYKEQQVHDLIIHVGKFNHTDPDCADVIKPIVPCQEQYHYRNKVKLG